ncbi:MAG: 4'-phosphopantetheinyl transferase superfamily protein [Chloroflexi bacterium]|nr:4'-phosphopantetheinyl transferase superfamily protein [Chloroflexota bacterium]
MDPGAPDAHRWWSPFLVSGEVAVTHVDLAPHPTREVVAQSWLDEVELARWGNYASEPRRRFVLCRAALRSLLCEELGCPNAQLGFQESEYGKPFALVAGQPAPISFNVSHSGSHGLIACAPHGRLGIDVEEIAPRPHLASLIEAVMAPGEQAELGLLSGDAQLCQFFRLWTCKEALIKALGTGFSTDISKLYVPAGLRLGERTGVFRFEHLPAVSWLLEDISGEGFAAALARELPER